MIRRLDLPVQRMNMSAVDGEFPGNTELQSEKCFFAD